MSDITCQSEELTFYLIVFKVLTLLTEAHRHPILEVVRTLTVKETLYMAQQI